SDDCELAASAAIACGYLLRTRNLSAGLRAVNGKGWQCRVGLTLAPVGETRVAEAGADGQYTPPVIVLHGRQFAEALHDRVVMDGNGGLVGGDERNRFPDATRQVEAAAFPAAGEGLGARPAQAVLP